MLSRLRYNNISSLLALTNTDAERQLFVPCVLTFFFGLGFLVFRFVRRDIEVIVMKKIGKKTATSPLYLLSWSVNHIAL